MSEKHYSGAKTAALSRQWLESALLTRQFSEESLPVLSAVLHQSFDGAAVRVERGDTTLVLGPIRRSEADRLIWKRWSRIYAAEVDYLRGEKDSARGALLGLFKLCSDGCSVLYRLAVETALRHEDIDFAVEVANSEQLEGLVREWQELRALEARSSPYDAAWLRARRLRNVRDPMGAADALQPFVLAIARQAPPALNRLAFDVFFDTGDHASARILYRSMPQALREEVAMQETVDAWPHPGDEIAEGTCLLTSDLL